MADDSAMAQQVDDPTIFALAYKKSRFFWFSRREGDQTGRDIYNEKNQAIGKSAKEKEAQLPNYVIIHTTMGDLQLELFQHITKKTVENFTTHARNGYYDQTRFHRVIKNFMVQGGDPEGDGTGGESIWGGEFEDEIEPSLRHDRPGVLSMANQGPNTNGSQFFITTAPAPWLDGKHTVFGRIAAGMETLMKIDKVRTDRFDRPEEDIKIINIDVQTR